MAGTLARSMPIIPPGMFLSQPPMTTTPSIHWPLHAGFDAVGDDFARDQRVLHAFGAHRHAVGDGRRAEDLRVAAGFLDAVHRRVGQLLQAAVAGRDGAVAVGDADHRLAEVGPL
jgi:hypothetical protein